MVVPLLCTQSNVLLQKSTKKTGNFYFILSVVLSH